MLSASSWMPEVAFDELEEWLGRQDGFPRPCSTAVAAAMSIYSQRSARPLEEETLLAALHAYLSTADIDEPAFEVVRDQAQLLALELDQRRGGPWPLTPGPSAKVIPAHHAIEQNARRLTDESIVKLFSAQILSTELKSLAAAARIASVVVYPPLGLAVASDPSHTIGYALGRAKKILVDYLAAGNSPNDLRASSKDDWNPLSLLRAYEERAQTLRDIRVPLARKLGS